MKVVLIVLSLALISGTTHAKRCTVLYAEAADLAVDNLDSWEAIQKNYVAYAQCDDGSIAEENSEAIARMLIDKWQDIAKLQSAINYNSGFENYVVRHIDATLDADDADTSQLLNNVFPTEARHCLISVTTLSGVTGLSPSG
ncbi:MULTISPECIES: hypothetical protein [Rahnella]|uniref:hypothetical protein n=1 Tax=Rahnella TaxID=34037 RepID=UPI0010DE071C|nr:MULTISPECIES: hypothetical protein [Rahnella]TCQ85174.1 hypothetical protein EC840_11091 [Rahnella sp. JUb53]